MGKEESGRRVWALRGDILVAEVLAPPEVWRRGNL
jgi:hypothetical protein